MLVALLGTVVQGVDEQRPDTRIVRNAHRAIKGVLQQSGSKLDALGPMVDGQPGQNHHWNGIGHIASGEIGVRPRFSRPSTSSG